MLALVFEGVRDLKQPSWAVGIGWSSSIGSSADGPRTLSGRLPYFWGCPTRVNGSVSGPWHSIVGFISSSRHILNEGSRPSSTAKATLAGCRSNCDGTLNHCFAGRPWHGVSSGQLQGRDVVLANTGDRLSEFRDGGAWWPNQCRWLCLFVVGPRRRPQRPPLAFGLFGSRQSPEDRRRERPYDCNRWRARHA